MKQVIHGVMQESVLIACGDGWFKLCTLIAQCTTGVQPRPAPEFNQYDSGQVRLLKSAIIHIYAVNCTLTTPRIWLWPECIVSTL